jgi:hypothetical protein
MGLFKLVAHCNIINQKLTPVKVGGIIKILRIVYFKRMFWPCKNRVLKPYLSSSEYACLPTHFCYFRFFLSHSNLYGHTHFHFTFLFSVVGIEKKSELVIIL